MDEAKRFEIGERIQNERRKHLMKQGDLSKVTGFAQSKISKHESGTSELTADDILVYCNVFNVSADYLLGIEKTDTRLEKSFNAYKLVNLSDSELDELDSFVDFLIYKRIRK